MGTLRPHPLTDPLRTFARDMSNILTGQAQHTPWNPQKTHHALGRVESRQHTQQITFPPRDNTFPHNPPNRKSYQSQTSQFRFQHTNITTNSHNPLTTALHVNYNCPKSLNEIRSQLR